MPKPPSELGKAGKILWTQVTSALEFSDPREELALLHSCLLQDDIARLRAELTGSPLVTKGSTGQPTESPLLGSIRSATALQSRLLATIAVDSDHAARSHAGRQLVAMRRQKGA